MSSLQSTELAATVEVPCPLCGSTRRKPLGSCHVDGQLIGVVQCAECSLVYSCPRLNPDVYARRWVDSYAYDVAPGQIQSWRENKSPNIRRDVAWLKRFLPAGARVLDVGCGPGFFLEQARAAGYVTSGTEVSRPSWKYATGQMGLDVRYGSLQGLSLSDRFDAITCFDVLYYLPDPAGDLREMRRLLNPGGLLMVRTANRIRYALAWQGIKRLLRRGGDSFDWNPFFLNAHLAQLDRGLLERMLRQAGFEPILTCNAALAYWPDQKPLRLALRSLAGIAQDAVWQATAHRLCLAPSVTCIARKTN